MPVPAGRAALIWLSLNVCDFRLSINRLEESVDVDCSKYFGEAELVGRLNFLIAEEDDAKFAEGLSDLLKLF